MPSASQVFTPNGIPIHSYVKRDAENYEGQLRNALSMPNGIVSLSGPSKSGKTVLLRKVVPADELIEVTGATIRTAADLWTGVLAWCNAPLPAGTTTTVGGELQFSGKGGGKIGIPFVAQGEAEASASSTGSYSRQTSEQMPIDLLAMVAREIACSTYSVFVDDFHYIPRDQQTEIAKQIKAASERGIRLVLASVPHRSDDAVRANSELRGRIEAIDVKYWSEDELLQIARTGLKALNSTIETAGLERMALESYGSPQLMQAICLQTCLRMRLDSDDHPQRHLVLDAADVNAILESTTSRSNFRSLLEALHAGPRQRGTERKEFELIDGSMGDVYRTILLALKKGEGTLSLTYDQVLQRVRDVCKTAAVPVGSSVQTSLEHMSRIANDDRHQPAVMEWDEDRLDVIDPYFLFYLRHSTALADLVA